MTNDNIINCANALISMKGYLTQGVTFTSSNLFLFLRIDPFFRLNEKHFAFHWNCSTNILARLLTVNTNGLLPQKMCDPILVTLLQMQPSCKMRPHPAAYSVQYYRVWLVSWLAYKSSSNSGADPRFFFFWGGGGVNFCNNVIEPKHGWGLWGLCISTIEEGLRKRGVKIPPFHLPWIRAWNFFTSAKCKR